MAKKANKCVVSVNVECDVLRMAKDKTSNMSALINDLLKDYLKYDDPLSMVTAKAKEHREKTEFYENRKEKLENLKKEHKELVEKMDNPLIVAINSVISIIDGRNLTDYPYSGLCNLARKNGVDPVDVYTGLPLDYQKIITDVNIHKLLEEE